MALRLVPLDRKAARRFVADHHRHAKPPSIDVIRVGVELDGKLVGVGMAARPLSRFLCDGVTLEITRVCTDGSRNACSILYGALARAAQALGYQRLVTYTLEEESGTSLLATGWETDPNFEIRDRDHFGWGRQKGGARSMAVDLFGNHATPHLPKRRWMKTFNHKETQK